MESLSNIRRPLSRRDRSDGRGANRSVSCAGLIVQGDGEHVEQPGVHIGDLEVVVQTFVYEGILLGGFPQSAARFMPMGTVTEAAVAGSLGQLPITVQQILLIDVPETEFANPRGVDQMTAFGKMEQARGGGGVLAQPRHLRDLAHRQIRFRQDGVHQRGFADPGLTDEDASSASDPGRPDHLAGRGIPACGVRSVDERHNE